MPRLYLLRHATAAAGAPGGGDHARPLTEGGRAEAARMGEIMRQRGDSVALVLASDSDRTRQTWDGVAAVLQARPKVRFRRDIYEAASYLPILRAEGGDAEAILLIGHNPTIQASAMELAMSLAGADGTALRREFPKGALAVFEVDGPWSSLAPGRATLAAFIKPR